MKKALILTDGKAGHENQSRAFARALGLDFDLVEVKFVAHGMSKVKSYLYDHLPFRWRRNAALFTVRPAGADAAAECPLADYAERLPTLTYPVVIGTGSGTFFAAKTLAKKIGAKCGVVLYPRGYRISTFDCVLAPAFDRPKADANVITIPANLVANDAAFYEKGVSQFQARAAAIPEIGVIIGGPNKCSTMSADWMKARLDEIFRLPGTKGVTTSRRTPSDVEAVIDAYPWDYKLIYSRDHFNPIPAFVSGSRRLFVTAESTGMLSEACTFGTAEVIALDNLNPGPHKFRRFVESLRAAGYVDGAKKIDLSAQFAAARRLLGC